MQLFKRGFNGKSRKRAVIALSFILAVSLVIGTAEAAFAWCNGGTIPPSYMKKLAKETADFSSPDLFTLNILPVVQGPGLGFGTHDYILEQAIAQAINTGVDVSWINVKEAQQGSSDPDTKDALKYGPYKLAGDYRGPGVGGTGPHDLGILYKEIVNAIDAGDLKTASRKLGWVAHYLGDMSQPYHVATWSQLSVIPSSRWTPEHAAIEEDLDYYMRYTIGQPPTGGPSDVDTARDYVPGLADVPEDATPQMVRLVWFGNKYTPVPTEATSAREVAIGVSGKIRNTYAKKALAAWDQTYETGYETKPDPHYEREVGSEWLLTNAPAMLNICSTGLATLIVELSDPALRANGIDQIDTPVLKVTKEKFPESETAGLSAKAKKAKLLELDRFQKYLGTVTINDLAGAPVREIPVKVSWKNKAKKVMKTETLWTNSKGQVTPRITVTKPAKDEKMTLSVTVPTSNYTKAKTKSFTVKKLVAYKVNWNGNKGKVSVKYTLAQKGTSVGTLAKATRAGYKSTGWYTKKAGGTKIKKTTLVKKNVTYYAHWKKK